MNSVLIILIIHVQDEFETSALDLDPQDQNGLQTSTVFEKKLSSTVPSRGAGWGRERRHFFLRMQKRPPLVFIIIITAPLLEISSVENF